MDGSCTVTFDGSYGGTYFLSCDAVNSFDNVLTFNGISSVYLYSDRNHVGNRLICMPGCQPAYVNSNEQYVYISPQNVTWNNRSLFYREYDIVFLFCIILLVCFRAITIFRR